MERLARGQSGDGDDVARDPDALDLLDLLDALAARFREKRADLLRWPWKLFCSYWARLYRLAADDRERDERRRQDEEFRKLAQMAQQAAGAGGDGGGGW